MQKITFIILIFILSGCGQLSSMMTGETLEKGEKTVTGAVLGYGVANLDTSSQDFTGIFPHLTAMGRIGLGREMDAGIKLSTGGNIKLDARRQFINQQAGKGLALSLGYDFEFQASNFQENIVTRHHVPCYFSYHFLDDKAIYITPRFMAQLVSNDDPAYFFGSSLGYQAPLSDKLKISVELSGYGVHTDPSSNKQLLYQGGVGMIWFLN